MSRVHEETQQWHDRRAPLIKRLEEHFKKRILVFQTSFGFHNGLISDEDASMLEEVLLTSKIRSDLLLVINSLGGFGLAAERIIRACRKYSKNGFEVLVPSMAKSAATIVCCGSHKIWMGESSELGPIDPQVIVSHRRVSAFNIIKSYDDLMKKGSRSRGRVEPYLHQLTAYDPRYIEQLRQELKLSESMAVQLLKSGMMRGKSETTIRRCIRPLIDPTQTLEHGRPIYHEQAVQCGLVVGKIGVDDPVWEVVWELQSRYDYVMGEKFAKCVESADDSYTLPGHHHHHDEEED